MKKILVLLLVMSAIVHAQTAQGPMSATAKNGPAGSFTNNHNTTDQGNPEIALTTFCNIKTNAGRCYGAVVQSTDVLGLTGTHPVGFVGRVLAPNPAANYTSQGVYGLISQAAFKEDAAYNGSAGRCEFMDPVNYPGRWNICWHSDAGAANYAFLADAACRITGTNTCNSQPIAFRGSVNGTDGPLSSIMGDSSGSLYLLPANGQRIYTDSVFFTPDSMVVRPNCSSGTCNSKTLYLQSKNSDSDVTASVSLDSSGQLNLTAGPGSRSVFFSPTAFIEDLVILPVNGEAGQPSRKIIFQYGTWTNAEMYADGSGTINYDRLKLLSGVDTNGAGLKHKRFTAVDAVGSVMCQTGNTVGATCDNVFNVPGTAFADTNYTIVCNVQAVATGVPVVQKATATSTSTFTVTIAALTAAGAQASYIGCEAVHD